MLVILSSVLLYGLGLGIIQGNMDPENHRYFWTVISLFSMECMISEMFGLFYGALVAVILEVIRQMEVKRRKQSKNSLDQ